MSRYKGGSRLAAQLFFKEGGDGKWGEVGGMEHGGKVRGNEGGREGGGCGGEIAETLREKGAEVRGENGLW